MPLEQRRPYPDPQCFQLRTSCPLCAFHGHARLSASSCHPRANASTPATVRFVLANARYGAEARLQVVRSVDRYSIVVTRDGPGEPQRLENLVDRRVAVPTTLTGRLRASLVELLDEIAPGWVEVPVGTGKEAVWHLVEERDVDAAASRHVYSGPNDLVGDGRKELEYDRLGTLRETRVIHTSERAVPELRKQPAENTGRLKQGNHAGCVIVAARRIVNRVVMSAEENMLTREGSPRQRAGDIRRGSVEEPGAHLETEALVSGGVSSEKLAGLKGDGYSRNRLGL